jgi:hypothetical protein
VKSWWDLGEGTGYFGSEPWLHEITCAFCMERGKFSLEHRATKKKPNSRKALNFDTLKCANCAGYVMILWSASEHGGDHHDYRVLPWPIRVEKYPKHWPEPLGRYWVQTHRSAKDENWDAALVMARSTLQFALRQHGAEGKTLKQEVDHLASQGVLPPHMKDWAHELRVIANESAHPETEASPADPQDVRDVIAFVDFLLQYLYDLPHSIKQYRERKSTGAA